jgi:glycosyltransferase involved in cell wall biosynthesis
VSGDRTGFASVAGGRVESSTPLNLVLLAHPTFLGLRSQDHFAHWLADAHAARGHRVELRRPVERLRRVLAPLASGPRAGLLKWAGYVDQYLLFPRALRAAMRSDPAGTLYVFCDQALGPWVPLAARRPHVVHTHDLLALQSALDEVPENPTGWTGRLYQRFIRAGFRQGRCFIAISAHTRAELLRLAGVAPAACAVVHNGLTHPYQPVDAATVAARLAAAGLPVDPAGVLLHVGGGQWYKHTAGVIALYRAHVERRLAEGRAPLALWLLSPAPGPTLQAAVAALPAGAQVRWLHGIDTPLLEALYSHARALLFPSLAEGFGWPIAEALACGCPVLTTDAAPMNEVGGDCADYLPRWRAGDDLSTWAAEADAKLQAVLERSPAEQAQRAAAAQRWARRYDADAAIDRYLAIYRQALQSAADPSAQSHPETRLDRPR